MYLGYLLEIGYAGFVDTLYSICNTVDDRRYSASCSAGIVYQQFILKWK